MSHSVLKNAIIARLSSSDKFSSAQTHGPQSPATLLQLKLWVAQMRARGRLGRRQTDLGNPNIVDWNAALANQVQEQTRGCQQNNQRHAG